MNKNISTATTNPIFRAARAGNNIFSTTKLYKEHVIKIGINVWTNLKKQLDTDANSFDILGDELVKRIKEGIPKKYKGAEHQSLFYLTFILLDRLVNQNITFNDQSSLKEEDKKQLNTFLDGHLTLINHKYTELKTKTCSYIACQIQLMTLIKDTCSPKEEVFIDLFKPSFSVLNQPLLFEHAESQSLIPFYDLGLHTFCMFLNQINSNNLITDWLIDYLIENFSFPDIYEKFVREYLYIGNFQRTSDSNEPLNTIWESVIIPNAIKAYKNHKFGDPIQLDEANHRIHIPSEQIPHFNQMEKFTILSAFQQFEKIKTLMKTTICGHTFQASMEILSYKYDFDDSTDICSELYEIISNWLNQKDVKRMQKLHAIEQFAMQVIFYNLGKNNREINLYETKHHFSSLSESTLQNLKNVKNHNKIAPLIDFIIQEYIKIEGEDDDELTKDRQQFFSIALAFSIAKKDFGLFNECALQMANSENKLEKLDAHLIILKRMKEFNNDRYFNYFHSLIETSLSFLKNNDFEELTKDENSAIENISKNINGYLENENISIKDTTRRLQYTYTSTQRIERIKAKTEIIEEFEKKLAIKKRTNSKKNMKTKNNSTSKSSKDKRKLPLTISIDDSNSTHITEFIKERISQFIRCDTLPLLSSENELTEKQKWEMVYFHCNIIGSFQEIDPTLKIGKKMEVILILKVFFEKIEVSNIFHSYKDLTIYELKQGKDYRLFVGKNKMGNYILIQSFSYSEIAHDTKCYIEEIKSIIDTSQFHSFND